MKQRGNISSNILQPGSRFTNKLSSFDSLSNQLMFDRWLISSSEQSPSSLTLFPKLDNFCIKLTDLMIGERVNFRPKGAILLSANEIASGIGCEVVNCDNFKLNWVMYLWPENRLHNKMCRNVSGNMPITIVRFTNILYQNNRINYIFLINIFLCRLCDNDLEWEIERILIPVNFVTFAYAPLGNVRINLFLH